MYFKIKKGNNMKYLKILLTTFLFIFITNNSYSTKPSGTFKRALRQFCGTNFEDYVSSEEGEGMEAVAQEQQQRRHQKGEPRQIESRREKILRLIHRLSRGRYRRSEEE